MMIFAVVALICLNIGTLGEAQLSEINREQGLTDPEPLTYLRQLEDFKRDGVVQQEQSAPQLRTFSDSAEAVERSNVKKHAGSPCFLTTCYIHHLSEGLHQAANSQENPKPTANADSPHSYGKK